MAEENSSQVVDTRGTRARSEALLQAKMEECSKSVSYKNLVIDRRWIAIVDHNLNIAKVTNGVPFPRGEGVTRFLNSCAPSAVIDHN